MTSQLTDNILNQIKERGLKPKPRWEFLLKNQVIWFIAAAVSLLGGVAVATMIFMVKDHDWYVFRYLDKSLLEHVIVSIPYLWLIILGLLVAACLYNIKNTKHGYRYEAFKLVLLSILASSLLGIIFLSLGFDSELHDMLMKQVPLYEKMTYTKDDIWIYPDKGLLSGQVVKFYDDGNFDLADAKSNLWLIEVNNETVHEAEFPPLIGERIKLTGKIVKPAVFEAYSLDDWDN